MKGAASGFTMGINNGVLEVKTVASIREKVHGGKSESDKGFPCFEGSASEVDVSRWRALVGCHY